MHIVLETPRLILRRFTEDDASLVYGLNSDAEVVKYVHEPTLQDVKAARQVIQHVILPQYANNLGRWAVHTKDNSEFIGWCGLKYLADPGEVDLGYRFHQFAWGKGYATESAKHVLNYGFEKLNLKEIIGRAHFENIASLNVLMKIGMQYFKDAVEEGYPVKVFRAIHNTDERSE